MDRPNRLEERRKLSPYIIFAFFFLVLLVGSFSFREKTPSRSANRSPLPSSVSIETNYYTDEVDWVSDTEVFEKGLREFYRKTGVQPYIYISGGDHGITNAGLQAFADSMYGTLFQDEAHFLLVFHEDGYGGYSFGYAVGEDAKRVMDEEAIEILVQNFKQLYTDHENVSDDELFGETFAKTADQIMPSSTKIAVILAGVILTIVILQALFGSGEQPNTGA